MNSVTLTFAANGQQLVRTGCEKFAANTVNYIQAKFDLGEGWDGFDSVRAVWQTDFVKIATVLDNDGNCTVPQEVLKRVNSIMVNLVGSISDGTELTDRLTTYKVKALDVNGATNIDGTETTEVTPSQFEQFVDIVEDEVAKVTGMTAEATTLPSGSDATASYSDGVLTLGIPKGDRGEEGPIGPQGPQGEVGPEGPQGPKGEDAVVPWDDILPTDTASGAVASFPDGSDLAPAKSLKVSLDPIQDLHGYDSPWVGGAGKNKVNCADISAPSTENTEYTATLGSASYVISFDIVNAVRTNLANTSFLNVVSSGENNYFTGETILKVSDNSTLNSAGANINGRYYCKFNGAIDSLVFLWRSNSYATLSSGAVKNIMVEVGNSATSFAPYTNICPISGRTEVVTVVSPTTSAEDGDTYTTDLGRTVYGGTLDVVSGELVVDRAMVTLDGSSDEPWSKNVAYGGYRLGILSDANIDGIPSQQLLSDKFIGSNTRGAFDVTAGKLLTYSANTGADTQFVFFATDVDTLDAWRTWLSNNPTQLVYPLATPQTIQLTPQEVQTLLGQNNVWSEQGNVEVVYKADIQRWVEKKLA